MNLIWINGTNSTKKYRVKSGMYYFSLNLNSINTRILKYKYLPWTTQSLLKGKPIKDIHILAKIRGIVVARALM